MAQSQALKTKAIDLVNPEPKTAQEAFDRWRENLSAKHTLAFGKRIEVKYISKFDDNVCPPNSRGRQECERVGFHSWFHHASDNQTSVGNLPPEGFWVER